MGQIFSACGLVEEAAQRSPIYRRSRVDPKHDDPTCALVHNDDDPMRFESKGLTPKEIDTPQTIFCLTNEGQPRWPTIPLWAKVPSSIFPLHHGLMKFQKRGRLNENGHPPDAARIQKGGPQA